MSCQLSYRNTLVLLLGLVSACRTPEGYRQAADDEVYALLDSRRDTMFGAPGGFTIDPPEDSLRQRILRGGWDSEGVYSLVEVLEVAAENNRDLQGRKESLYGAALDLTLERWQFGWRPGGSVDGSVAGGQEAEDASFQGGLTMTKLLGSGASIVTSIGSNLFRVVSTGDGWDAIGDIGLTVTQPLLRGVGKRIVEESLTQAERDLVYEVRSYERFRRTFAVDTAGQVYSLLQAEDEVGNEERNYRDLVALRERNEESAKAGRISDIEADQARQNELSSEATLLRLRANLERQRDQFNLFLGLPIDTRIKLDPAEFSSLSDVDPLLEGLDSGLVIDYALGARLDHQTTLDTVDDRERKVSLAEDALRAGLSLSASATQTSELGRPLEPDQSDLNWSAGLGLDLPLDRKAERNAYRSSLISLDAARRDAELAADAIKAEVRDAFRQAENARKGYAIQRGAIQLAKRRVESATLNLDAGRADTRDALEAQEALVNTENAATAALIDFTLARLELYLRLELLRIDDSGIHVDVDLTSGLLKGTE